jgi:predicted HTH domain antitoxin
MSARELTVIELYRSGDLPLEKAAGFLGVTPAAFAELAEQASRQ